MHEVYAAPRGCCENTYVDFRPFGTGKDRLFFISSSLVFTSLGFFLWLFETGLKGELIEALRRANPSSPSARRGSGVEKCVADRGKGYEVEVHAW